MSDVTTRELLYRAIDLLERPSSETVGLWPRATAVLARQALEQGLTDVAVREGGRDPRGIRSGPTALPEDLPGGHRDRRRGESRMVGVVARLSSSFLRAAADGGGASGVDRHRRSLRRSVLGGASVDGRVETSAFLFTDIEGSTNLLRDLGVRYRTLLLDHRSLLTTAFERFGGRLLGIRGRLAVRGLPDTQGRPARRSGRSARPR